MNLVSCLYRKLCFLSVFTFAPAVLLAVDLVTKHPPIRPADANSPTLIWDIDLKLANALPRNFRATDGPVNAMADEIRVVSGLRDLHASGSGEFTPEGLKLVLTLTHGAVTVFDLRQETHVFVNDLPVSWYASRDWVNVGRSQRAIEEDELTWVQSLKP